MIRRDRVYRTTAFHRGVAARAVVFPNKIHPEVMVPMLGSEMGPS